MKAKYKPYKDRIHVEFKSTERYARILRKRQAGKTNVGDPNRDGSTNARKKK